MVSSTVPLKDKRMTLFLRSKILKRKQNVQPRFSLYGRTMIECLQHLRDKTHRTMRCGQQDKGETDQKKMSKEADDNEKNKTELKRASLNHLIVEVTYRHNIRAYVFGIIERACAKVQEDIISTRTAYPGE